LSIRSTAHLRPAGNAGLVCRRYGISPLGFPELPAAPLTPEEGLRQWGGAHSRAAPNPQARYQASAHRAEAAARCGVNIAKLKRLRTAGTGPAFIRLSPGRIAYRLSDLAAWLEACRQGGSHVWSPASPLPARGCRARTRRLPRGAPGRAASAPTGVGKTVMFSYIASAAVTRGKRVLFLVHRHEL